jgi:radical SAM protein with 4Fe4S-binding SPASM domain
MSKLTRNLKSVVAEFPLLWRNLKKGQEIKFYIDYLRFYSFLATAKASTKEINLEFSSACNLRCKFCALDHNKPKVYMNRKVLEKVFRDLLQDERFSNVKTINLHNGGETLMHPHRLRLFQRLAAFKGLYKVKGRRFPKIVLLTNGMLLREKLSCELLKMHVLDEVGFSLDGGSPEAFEDMRVNSKWEKFARNVEDFVDLRNEIDPKVQTFGVCIVPRPHSLSDEWMDPRFQRIARKLDSVEFRRLHDWGGKVEIDTKAEVNKNGCDLLMKQLVILPNGDVTVCCNDLNAEGVVGNVLNTPLYDIYKSTRRLEYLRLMKNSRKDEIDLCRKCVSY